MKKSMNGKVERGLFISNELKKIAEHKQQSPGDIAKIMKVAQPTISHYLNATKIPSDKQYKNISEALGLSESKFKNILFEADNLVMQKKYPEKFQNSEMSNSEIASLDVMLSREYGVNDDEALQDIKNYIEFRANKIK